MARRIDKATLLEYLDSGLTIPEIADQFGTEVKYIRRSMIFYGLHNPEARRVTEEKKTTLLLDEALDGKADVDHTHSPSDVSPQGAGSGLDADLLDGQHASAFAASAHTHDAADIASGVFADARIAQSNVTQHQSALSISAAQINDNNLGQSESPIFAGATFTGDVKINTAWKHHLTTKWEVGFARITQSATYRGLQIGATENKNFHIGSTSTDTSPDRHDFIFAGGLSGPNDVILGVTRTANGGVSWTPYLRMFGDGKTQWAKDATFDSAVNVVGALTKAGNTVWHAGNDGPGSGLDADTLDGVEGSGYALSSHSHALGDLSNVTATGEGSGGGFDADLLDGQHASAFAQLSGADFTGDVQITTSANANFRQRRTNWDAGDYFARNVSGTPTGATLRVRFWDSSASAFTDIVDYQRGGLSYFYSTPQVNGNTVWHAGNLTNNQANWDTAYDRSVTGFQKNIGNSGELQINRQGLSNPTAQLGSLYVGDARLTADFLNSDGTSNYMPAPEDSQLNKGITPIFSQGWGGASWGSIVTSKGWTGTYYAWQIAGPASSASFGASDEWYLRKGSGASWDAWREILHEGNFANFGGAGSGLDADTVDGQHASAFAAVSHTHAPGDISPQGAGSGLDADTVDGNHASAFALSGHTHNVIQSLGVLAPEDTATRNVHETGIYTFNAHNTTLNGESPTRYWSILGFGRGTGGMAEIAIGWTGSGDKMFYRSLRDTTNDWFPWREVWHAGSDGAGSGLDADMVDGLHASAFALSGHTHALGDLSNVTATGEGAGGGFDADMVDGQHAADLGGPVIETASIANDSQQVIYTLNTDEVAYLYIFQYITGNGIVASRAEFLLAEKGPDVVQVEDPDATYVPQTGVPNGAFNGTDGQTNIWLDGATGDVYIHNREGGSAFEYKYYIVRE